MTSIVLSSLNIMSKLAKYSSTLVLICRFHQFLLRHRNKAQNNRHDELHLFVQSCSEPANHIFANVTTTSLIFIQSMV